MENWRRRHILPRFASLSFESPLASPPRHRSYVRWLASCSTIVGGSFVLRWFVRLRPQQENGKGKPVSSAATDGRMAQEGRGEERRRRWLLLRRRFPSLPLELGAPLALSLARSHAGRLSDPVLKIDGGSMQLALFLPRSLPPSLVPRRSSFLPYLDSMIASFPFLLPLLLLPLRAALKIIESAIAL